MAKNPRRKQANGSTNPGFEPVTYVKDDPRRTIGLGYSAPDTASRGRKVTDIVAILKEAMGCQDPNYLPTIAKVEWEFDRPMLPEELQSTLGDQIDQLASGNSVAGVQKVYSTPGLIDGQFQTFNLAMAVGSHFRISSVSGEIDGCGFTRPPGGGTVGGIYPDDSTRNDLLNGALGYAWEGTTNDDIPIFPARMQYNWWLAMAFAAAIKGLNFRWSYGSLVNIFEDQLANTAFLQFMTQDGASGSSQVDALDMIERMNESYASAGSPFDFAAKNRIRYGSHGDNSDSSHKNLGLFKGYDGDIFDAAYGAGGLRALFGECCSNAPFRMLRKAYLLQPGVPPGLFYESSNNIQMELFRRYMDITIGQGDSNIPPMLTPGGKTIPGWAPDLTAFPNADQEKTLDTTPAFLAQQRWNAPQVWKATDGGFWSTNVLGWEVWRTVAKAVENDPDIAAEVQRQCGCALGWTN